MPSSRTSAPAEATGPKVAVQAPGWSALDWQERHDVMTFAVLPVMSRRFQEFEHGAEPDLRCTSCHGEQAEAVEYRMPSAPPLDPRDVPEPGANLDARAPVVRFMVEEVTPLMIELLETEPFDPKTQRGFFCFNCHQRSAPSQAGSDG